MSAAVLSRPTLTADDHATAATVIRDAAAKALQVLATTASALGLQASGKDGIAPVQGLGLVGQFVGEAHALQGLHGGHEGAQAGGCDDAAQLAIVVAQPDDHIGASAAGMRTGLRFDGGAYLLVVGAKCYPLEMLRSHAVLSGSEIAVLTYVGRYLRKATAAALWLVSAPPGNDTHAAI